MVKKKKKSSCWVFSRRKRCLLFSSTGKASQPVLWRALKHIFMFTFDPFQNLTWMHIILTCWQLAKSISALLWKVELTYIRCLVLLTTFTNPRIGSGGCLKSRGKFPRRKKEIDLSYQKGLYNLVNKFERLAYVELNDKLKLFSWQIWAPAICRTKW